MKIELEEPFKSKWKTAYLRTRKDNRKIIDLVNSDNDRTSISYARYKMGVKLGYEVSNDLEVDHDVNGKAKQELDKLLVEEYKPKAEETFKEIFTETAKSMSATMFYKSMSMSLTYAHENMKSSLLSVGIQQNPGSPLIPKPASI